MSSADACREVPRQHAFRVPQTERNVKDRTVTTADGVRLRTRMDGDPQAPPLLLLNSLGTDLTMWDPQIGAWGTHRRIIRFDQRGQGSSDVPLPPYSVEGLGRDALTVLDVNGIARSDVCGISLGGVVAMWIAAARPHRVRRLVLADTAVRVGTEQAWGQRIATVRAHGMDEITDHVLARFFSPGFLASGSPTVQAFERTLRAASVDGYTGSCAALATADLADLVQKISSPSLVIVGTADAATPPADAERLHNLLLDSRLVDLPGAGHLANVEQPERFARLVLDFLTSTVANAMTHP